MPQRQYQRRDEQGNVFTVTIELTREEALQFDAERKTTQLRNQLLAEGDLTAQEMQLAVKALLISAGRT